MYKLKNFDNTLNGYRSTITDEEYSNLTFYKKWKYQYCNVVTSRGDDKYYDTYNAVANYDNLNNSSNLLTNPLAELTNILVADVLLNTFDENQIIDTTLKQEPDSTQNTFDGFGGGSFGGGGSEGTWIPDAPQADEIKNINESDSNSYSQPDFGDSSSYDSSSNDQNFS